MSDQPQYPQYPGAEGNGDNPPSAPPPGQVPPAYGQPAYGQPAYGGYPPPGYGQMPPDQAYPGQPVGFPYASWWSRVGAALLDALIATGIFLIPVVVGAVIAFQNAEVDPVTDEITGGVEPIGVFVMVLAGLGYIVFDIWNRGVRVGTKGQSLGKKMVGIRIVHAETGQLIGGGSGFLRWLMAFVFGFIPCGSFLDVLWPLWDDKKQTLHDKVVGSVALRV